MTTTTDLALNVRRARVMAGLTQDAAAQKAGLTRVGYRSIEAGTTRPRPETLGRLSTALEVKVGDLLRPGIPLPRARFRSLKRLNDREELLLTVARQIDDYAGLEDLLGERTEYRLRGLSERLPGGDDRPRNAASAARAELGLGDEPIRDITGLLEDRIGVKVTRLPVRTEAFFGLSIAEDGLGPAIAVNTSERISVERWIFSAAHELGHLVLHAADFDPVEAAEDPRSEREANVFASYFLMPPGTFDDEWDDTSGGDLWDRVMKVKRMFGVSYKTVLYRLHDERKVPDIWVRFQAAAKRRLGRALSTTDEPEPLAAGAFGYGNPEPRKALEPGGLTPIEFLADRRARLVRRAVENGHISLGRGAEILGLSLREMMALRAGWL